ncbi:hypothetical protein AB0F17_22320 [Nonomuraea sp. NPDC026600]|uniref:hypothetical protein n=1 Tax=Nonomuraea sp. NPDC026600 TaxID=3155363 RepID=UPI0033D7DDD6
MKGAKKVLVLSAVVGLTLAGLSVTTAHASAFHRFSDGFEGNPLAHWQPLTNGDGRADFDINEGFARTGKNNGWLYTGQGWAAERIAVPIGAWGGDRSNCMAEIYAQPLDGGAQVGLEIWDPNGWRKLTSTAPWLPGPGYQPIRTSRVDLSRIDTVYVQAIFGKDNGVKQFVRLDDMSLLCG